LVSSIITAMEIMRERRRRLGGAALLRATRPTGWEVLGDVWLVGCQEIVLLTIRGRVEVTSENNWTRMAGLRGPIKGGGGGAMATAKIQFCSKDRDPIEEILRLSALYLWIGRIPIQVRCGYDQISVTLILAADTSISTAALLMTLIFETDH
jgi:hypothetical protein